MMKDTGFWVGLSRFHFEKYCFELLTNIFTFESSNYFYSHIEEFFLTYINNFLKIFQSTQFCILKTLIKGMKDEKHSHSNN